MQYFKKNVYKYSWLIYIYIYNIENKYIYYSKYISNLKFEYKLYRTFCLEKFTKFYKNREILALKNGKLEENNTKKNSI